MAALDQLPAALRVANAVTAYPRYLVKLIFPAELAVYYPFPKSFAPAAVLAAGTLLVCITALSIRWRNRRAYFLVGWFWFLGALFPTIGLVQVGGQSIADRYTYIPSIGLFIAVVWAAADAVRGQRIATAFGGAIAGVVVLIFAALTWVQAGYWRNTETLFSHAAAVTEDNWLAMYELGYVDMKRGDYAAAIGEFQEVIRVNPVYVKAYVSLGDSIYTANPKAAIPYYQNAVKVGPNDFAAHASLANAPQATGDLEGAAAEYREVVRLMPDLKEARKQLDEVERAMKAH